MRRVKFSNPYFGELAIPDVCRLTEYSPKTYDSGCQEPHLLLREALAHPIGCDPISFAVKPSDKVLIIIDDKSRATPVDVLLPFVIQQLRLAGVADQAISILVALGTHRPMTPDEIKQKTGVEIAERFRVLNHAWDDPDALRFIGTTQSGNEMWVNKLAVEADYIIGLGHIVPHRVAGFSGGGKIIQPGISGLKTTGRTHWMSAYYSAEEILGNPDNPVRRDIEEVALSAGLKFIINVVQDSAGRVAGVFAGHPIAAHREGCRFAKKIYGVPVGEKADIVISEAYPAEIELWQATKALQAADIVVKPGGTVILLASCPEGSSRSHGKLIEQFGFRPLAEVETLLETGVIEDLNVASYLARVGNVLSRIRAILVSQGISAGQGEKMRFTVARDVETAFRHALSSAGANPTVAILHQGSELLPILSKAGG